jgi:hypothetical protein
MSEVLAHIAQLAESQAEGMSCIKGNMGDQNYTLGPDVDLSKYRAVSVWCKRFSVNFGAAPLTPDRAMSEM